MYLKYTCKYAYAVVNGVFCLPFFSKKYKQKKQNDGGVLYENSELKSSDGKYVTLTAGQPQVPLYETPKTLTDTIKLKFNKKDKNTYANEKPKTPKKPDTKVKNYANINFMKGKNKLLFLKYV